MITILLAEDHVMVRTALRQLLDRQPDMRVVAEVATGMDAVATALQLVPAVVILDIGLPDIDGLDALERIKLRAPQIRVLVLTGQDNEIYVLRALHGGASGYILKHSHADALLRAVWAVARGQLAFDGVDVEGIIETYSGRSGPRLPSHSTLTEREREVLRLVACGYSNTEIASQLMISPKTVDTHRTRVMDKLNLHTRAALTNYALRQGFLVTA